MKAGTAAAALLAAVAVAQAPSGTVYGSSAPRGLQPAQWRVVWTEDPQTRAVVAWSTAERGSSHRVLYDASPGGSLDFEHEVDANSGRYSGSGSELYWHHARLAGLEPDTEYRFVMASDDARSPELRFRTAPAAAKPLRILSGGDSRSDREQRRALNAAIARLAAEHDVLALAHGGDYVMSGVSLEQWSRWLTDHELTTTATGRVLPVVPTRGNHESWGELYEEVFAEPGVVGNWYATELSPEVLLVTLNTETAAGGEQAAFLRETLSSSDAAWKLVQYHRAIMPAVKRPARAKPHWQPLFERYGVDVALESDGHVLKRTPPIRGDEVADGGVVYVGEGGLGVPQRTPDRERWWLQPPGTAQAAHHVWLVAVTAGNELRLTALAPDGTVLDEVALQR